MEVCDSLLVVGFGFVFVDGNYFVGIFFGRRSVDFLCMLDEVLEEFVGIFFFDY